MWDNVYRFTDTSVYFIVAVSASLLFIIRMGLMMLGHGHGDLGHVHGGDTSHPGDSSSGAFNLFSIQSVLGFFMGTGWMGLAARLEWGMGPGPALATAVGFGVAMMLFSAALTFYMQKLNSEPRLDLASCVGTTGRVYLTIPAHARGTGQVEVNVSGQRKILEALTRGGEIAAFQSVKIVAVDDFKRAVVEPA
jgi:hypothetical protein